MMGRLAFILFVRCSMEYTFTDANFAAEVLQASTPVLVDFWAPWCGPCRMMGPVVEELAHELEGKMKIGKMNVDENNQTPGQYGVQSIPTLLVVKNGNVVDQFVGAMAKEALIATRRPRLFLADCSRAESDVGAVLCDLDEIERSIASRTFADGRSSRAASNSTFASSS